MTRSCSHCDRMCYVCQMLSFPQRRQSASLTIRAARTLESGQHLVVELVRVAESRFALESLRPNPLRCQQASCLGGKAGSRAACCTTNHAAWEKRRGLALRSRASRSARWPGSVFPCYGTSSPGPGWLVSIVVWIETRRFESESRE